MSLKKILSVILAVSLLCTTTISVFSTIVGAEDTVATEEVAVNWFTDSGFDDSENVALAWNSTWNPPTVSVGADPDDETNNVTILTSTIEGSTNLKIDGLQPLTEYTLKFQAKTTGNATSGVNLYETGAVDIWVQLTEEWADYEITFTTGTGYTSAQIFIWNKGEMTTYVDNYELMYVPAEEEEDSDSDVVDNNPAGEVLAEETTVFPMSDSENTMNWSFSETMSDEFDEEELDSALWFDKHQYWAGRTPSYFQTENVRVEDGYLILTSNMGEVVDGTQTYDAASVQSTQTTGYGYYEISSRTAPISMANAFWFQANSSVTEIDVFEQLGAAKTGHDSSDYPINTHYYPDGWDTDTTNPYTYDTGVDLTDDFHTYGLEWGPDYLKFYFDGKLVRTIENDYFHESLNIFFDTETFEWNGYPVAEDFYYYTDPVTGEERYSGDYYVDYIRVWRTDEEQVEAYPDAVVYEYKETQTVYGTPELLNEETGEYDSIWETAESLNEYNIVSGGLEKLYANMEVKTMWDEDNLYILTMVEDEDVFINETNLWNGDCIDMYFDLGNEKDSTGYDDNDFSIKMIPNGEGNSQTTNAPEGIEYNTILTDEGYTIQCSIPWVSMEVEAGTVIGFDAQLNEGSNEAAQRNAIVIWNSVTGDLWQNMETIGDLKLVTEIEVDPEVTPEVDPEVTPEVDPDTDVEADTEEEEDLEASVEDTDDDDDDDADTDVDTDDDSDEESPETGDTSNASIVFLMIVSMLGVVSIVIYRKKA